MKKVDFICIGPGRTGTTWLFNYLRGHPDLSIFDGKEINFFNDNYDKGKNWYLSKFKARGAIGEISNNYFFHEDYLKRIVRDMPSTKIILCIRNPVDLLDSIYGFSKRRSIAIEGIDDFLNYPYLKIMGSSGYNYEKKYLGNVKESFNLLEKYNFLKRENMKIFIFDHAMLETNQKLLVKSLCEFLSISHFENHETKSKVNQNMVPRINKIGPLMSLAATLFKRFGLSKFVGYLKTSKYFLNLFYKTDEQKNLPRLEDYLKKNEQMFFNRISREYKTLQDLAKNN